MAGRDRITLGLALLVAAVAVIGQVYTWIAWPITLFALFLIVWGRAPNAVETYIARLPGGNRMVGWLHGLDAIITPRDPEQERIAEKRRELVKQAFAKLSPEDVQWLRRMSIGGRPVGMPAQVGNSLGDAGLL